MIDLSATHVLLAGALDLMIGDPRWLPHPVRFIGRAVTLCENVLRRIFTSPRQERMAGVLLVGAVVIPVYVLAAWVTELLGALQGVQSLVGTAALVLLMATTIAIRELLVSVKRVVRAIDSGDLETGRQHVSMIVGRDTGNLDEQEVLRAAIESLAENLSDGVVAPLFYLALGGLPLALAYKAVNTLDSMVGYKNDRYLHFGRAAARLDDVANYLPARLTGLLIAISVFLYSLTIEPGRAVSRSARSFSVMVRDGRKHPSPNSGIPEAAMAGAVGARLGGPSAYGGVVGNKPFIGDALNNDMRFVSKRALAVAFIASLLALCLAAGVTGVKNL